jgi:hypothetical protein
MCWAGWLALESIEDGGWWAVAQIGHLGVLGRQAGETAQRTDLFFSAFGEDLVAQPDALRADPHPRPCDEPQFAAALLAAEGTSAIGRLARPAAARLADASVAGEFLHDGRDVGAELAEYPPRPGSGSR